VIVKDNASKGGVYLLEEVGMIEAFPLSTPHPFTNQLYQLKTRNCFTARTDQEIGRGYFHARLPVMPAGDYFMEVLQ
jgi:hypothetical protein